MHSRHTEIYPLSLHDALPISSTPQKSKMKPWQSEELIPSSSVGAVSCGGVQNTVSRSGEQTHALPAHRDLPSFPTRRSSDLLNTAKIEDEAVAERGVDPVVLGWCGQLRRRPEHGLEIGRADACTPGTPRSTLFPYTTLFRSPQHRKNRR